MSERTETAPPSTSARRPEGAPWPIEEAASFLSVSSRHLWRLIDASRVKAIRIGRRVLIPAHEMERLAREGCR
jgi:excisionase family DNA binding protein